MTTTYEALNAASLLLTGRDREFADSLLTQWRQGREWSAKQAYWAGVLAERPNLPAAEKVVGDMQPILVTFETAAKHLKRPGFRFALNTTTALRIALAGSGSRNAGDFYVTGDARSEFDERPYFGRLDRKGEFHPAKDGRPPADIRAALVRFASDPVGQAREYARLFGRCCFCNRELTDERSTNVGYGPDCAEHYGLPWSPRDLARAA